MPKNILMTGPTGCGKTEIVRRLAKLLDAPFIKVEATKYTEVGFHGKDVDTIVKDLMDVAVVQTREKMRKNGQEKVVAESEKLLLDALIGRDAPEETRVEFRDLLRGGHLEDKEVMIELPEKKSSSSSMGGGMDIQKMTSGDSDVIIGFVNGLMNQLGGGGNQDGHGNNSSSSSSSSLASRVRMSVSEARRAFLDRLVDDVIRDDDVIRHALHQVQEHGIVVIDEIDKICVSHNNVGFASGGGGRNPDASNEGVQRDLLPLVEGTIVPTRHGNVDTARILFIAAGAFHSCKPSDMLAELQGRLPIRVELSPLSQADLLRILLETKNGLLSQQRALMATEGVDVEIDHDAIEEMAKAAHEMNTTMQNVGARRLHAIVEKVFEDVSFHCQPQHFHVTKQYVREKVKDLIVQNDLSRFTI